MTEIYIPDDIAQAVLEAQELIDAMVSDLPQFDADGDVSKDIEDGGRDNGR
jgi:hypothetical protein